MDMSAEHNNAHILREFGLNLFFKVLEFFCLDLLEETRNYHNIVPLYRGADKSLARPERKQATVKKDFDFHVSYL